MKKVYYAFCVAMSLCVNTGVLYAAGPAHLPANPGNPPGGHGGVPKNYNGFLPYPVIDLTNGIPPWVTNYNNNTESVPLDKGAYVKSYDNVSQDGKMYYQTFTQSGTGVTIVNVKKNRKRQDVEGMQETVTTYESNK